MIANLDKITGFLSEMNFSKNKPPVRVYAHQAGFEGCSSYASLPYEGFEEALKSIKSKISKLDYILATTWADEKTRAKNIEFFGFKLWGKWPGNPEMYAWQMQNRVYVPNNKIGSRAASCGDGLIMLAQEEIYRRSCKNLREYTSRPAIINNIF
jgi:hypothetical protein